MAEPVTKIKAIFDEMWSMVTDKNGKFSFAKSLFLVAIGAGLTVFSNLEPILTKLEYYNRLDIREDILLEMERDRVANLTKTLPEVMEPMYDYIAPDLLAVFKYYPTAKRTYNRMIYHVGKLPNGLTMESFKRITTEKTHPSVIAHMQGIPYNLGPPLPIAKPFNMVVYGCPIYNSDAIYDGVVAFYWHEQPKNWNQDLMDSSCASAAREIGRFI